MMKQFLSAFMTFVLLATGCGAGEGTGNSGLSPAPKPSAHTLAQPVYPEFPAYPEEPGPSGDWDAYFEDLSHYQQTLAAIRGDGMRPEDCAALNAFAARSIPLVLAGCEGENAVYSPLSLWSALAMLAQCADGESRRQVLDAMEAGSMEQVQETVSRTWQALYTEDGVSSLTLANSLWLNSAAEGTYVPDTLDILARKHFASVHSVPMGTGEADQAVSGWVKEQSHGLIGGTQPVVQTRVETLALLASSLYYRAGWENEFLSQLTQEDIFTDASGQESRTDFMHKTTNANFLREKDWQAAQLETRLGGMVFVLPDEGVTPESLLQDPQFLSKLDFNGANRHHGEVRWSVPKFDVDSNLDLKGALTAMGITDLLGDAADLSALTSLDACLSEARQLARVKVDEEGVEAAAVTILMMDTTSAMLGPAPEICIMDLERPFLFVIHTDSGIPLFVGIVNTI